MGTILFVVSVIAALTLWIPFFIFGIYKLIKKENKKGTYLLIASAAWCVLILGAVILTSAYFMYDTFKNIRASQKTVDFKPEEYHGEMGEITLTYGKNATLTAYDSKNSSLIKSSGADGVIKFPSGQYSFSSLAITEKDSDGRDWTLSVPLYKNFSTVEISKDKPVEIKTTPPFIATVVPSNKSGKDVFDFELKDVVGNSVSISDNTRSKPPKFQLVDSGGTVVFEKNFDYG